MAKNKVEYFGTVLIDLTSDTATAADIANGKTAHIRSGEQVTGSLQFVTYYTGTTAPSSSLGSDGDIYLKVAS